MKRLSLIIAALLLAGSVVPASSQSESEKAKFDMARAKEETVAGYIGDAMCGLEHPMNTADAKMCTLKCVEGGSKFVLADRAHKVVYSLVDEDSQKKAKEFAGQKVSLTGHARGRTGRGGSRHSCCLVGR